LCKRKIQFSSGDAGNCSMNNTLVRSLSFYDPEFLSNKEKLKYDYIIAYILARASMWSKAPYLYTLYSQYHGFTVDEIGLLYIIDGFTALVSGPITGGLADKYGRRLFCQLYNLLIIINLSIRLTRVKFLAYMAQILTGIGTGLINTSFESWVVKESEKKFVNAEEERGRFLKKLFKTTTIIDAVMSIVVSAFTAVVYTYFGIEAPFFISIILSFGAMVAMQLLWDENVGSDETDNKNTYMEQKEEKTCEALEELKERNVLSIGLIESFFQACFNIYLFSWTPILTGSTPLGKINVGYTFCIFIFTMILGTNFFEIFILYGNFKFYKSLTFLLFFEAALFLLIYFIENYYVRLALLACINGCSGFYCPLNSIIKSKIINDKYRALLMNLFRVPLNIYVIIALFSLKFMDPFKIVIISSVLMVCAFLIGLQLTIWPTPMDEGIESSSKKAKLQQSMIKDK